jgi:hypothetical protein
MLSASAVGWHCGNVQRPQQKGGGGLPEAVPVWHFDYCAESCCVAGARDRVGVSAGSLPRIARSCTPGPGRASLYLRLEYSSSSLSLPKIRFGRVDDAVRRGAAPR